MESLLLLKSLAATLNRRFPQGGLQVQLARLTPTPTPKLLPTYNQLKRTKYTQHPNKNEISPKNCRSYEYLQLLIFSDSNATNSEFTSCDHVLRFAKQRDFANAPGDPKTLKRPLGHKKKRPKDTPNDF